MRTAEPTVTVAHYEDHISFGTSTRDDVAGVIGRLEEIDGRLVLTELTFTAKSPQTTEITSSTLRALRMDAVLSVVRGRILETHAQIQVDGSDVDGLPTDTAEVVKAARKQIARAATAAAARKASGRRGYGDDFYRLVAIEYVELTKQGKGGRGVLSALAQVMAKRLKEQEPRPRDNIRDWVAEARRRGFLTPGQPGRGGGGPGPRLYAQDEATD